MIFQRRGAGKAFLCSLVRKPEVRESGDVKSREAPGKSRETKTWRDCHEINSALFPLPAELKDEPGFMQTALHSIPADVLADASRCPEPWCDLEKVQFLAAHRSLFRACASVLPAWVRLTRIATERAKLNTDWVKELEKDRGSMSAQIKVFDRLWQYEAEREAMRSLLNDPDLDPEMRRCMEWHIARRTRELIKRGKRDEATEGKPLPRGDAVRERPLETELVEHWIRFGNSGPPGLMFWRNEVLGRYLQLHLDQKNLGPGAVKKIRQRLGLKPVSDRNSFVWDLSVSRNAKLQYEITGFQRNGKLAFSGVISSSKSISSSLHLSMG